MPEPIRIERAELRELLPNGKESADHRVKVQFNPESLKVSFANQIEPPRTSSQPKARDQRGTAPAQFVGRGTTTLAIQLWFDVTGELHNGQSEETDVRQLTRKVAHFITPRPAPDNPDAFTPPGVRFIWGTFQFDGLMVSLEETLEYFSPEGKPQRANVTLSLVQQEIQFGFAPGSGAQAANNGRPAAGTQALTQALAGSTVQGLAAQAGRSDDWQRIAAANGIENPRLLAPGQMLNLNPARTSRPG
jgi:hypothetical protein